MRVELDNHWTGTCTSASGQYTLSGVPLDEPLTVFSGGDNWCEGGSKVYLQEWWQDAYSYETATPVTLTLAERDRSGIDFSLLEGGTVSGRVFKTDGVTPIAGAWISVEEVAHGWGLGGAETGADGSYTVVRIPPLDVRVRADATNYAFEYYNNAGQNGDNATPLSISLGTNTPNINFTLGLSGTISGTVYADDGVTPLANMMVDVDNHWVGTCTDADGHFTLYGLPLNEPLIVFSGGDNWCEGGSKAYLLEWWQNAYTYETATPITLTLASRNRTGINFSLLEGGTISGYVFETDGVTPIEGAWINVEDIAHGWGLGGAETGADGGYTVVRIPPLDVRVRADATDYAFEYYHNAGQNGENATPLSISLGTNTPDINFSLGPSGTISGTVYAEDGVTPLANMMVDVDNHWVGTCTDADGHFTLYSLPLGEPLTVFSGGDNWCEGGSKAYLQEWWQDAYSYETATAVTLTLAERDRSGIDFTLQMGGTISGTVTDQTTGQPLENMVVNVSGDNFGRGVCSAADGSYTVYGVPFNISLEISTGGSDNWCGGSADYVQETWREKNGWWDATALTLIEADPELTGINFTPMINGKISGIVRDQVSGQPLANINVDVFLGNDSWMGTCTDASGHYHLNVPYGMSFTVAAAEYDWCGGPTNFAPEYWQEMPDRATAAFVTTTKTAPNVTGINFTLGTGGGISGQVTAAESSEPLADVWLCAFDYAAPTFEQGNAWKCTQTGPDGTYQLSGVQPGMKRVWIFPEDRLRLFYNNSSTFAGATPVQVNAGATTPNINFSLPLAGIISGQIYAEDGVTPLSGVTISTGNGEYPECSQPDGSYRIFVPAGTHNIKAEKGMCSDAVNFPTQYYNGVTNSDRATPVSINTGETVPVIDFTLQLYPSTPTELVVQQVIQQQVALAWIDNAADETGFRIERSADGTDWMEIASVEADHTTYQDLGLDCHATYWYRVRAYRDSDATYSPYSGTASATTDDCSLVAPVLESPLDETLTTNNNPVFTWLAVAGAQSYEIEIDNHASFLSPEQRESVDALTYAAATLADGSTYFWRVRAADASGGVSAWSAAWTITIDTLRLRAPLLALPKDRSNTPDQTPTLSWGAVSGAKAYQVQWSSDPLLAGALEGQVTTLTYTVPEQPYGVYFWRVRAQDAAVRWSDWSLTRTLTITLLSTPTNAQHLTDTTPAFVWKAVTGASEYHLEVYDDEALTNIVFQFTGLGTTTTASTLVRGAALVADAGQAGRDLWHMDTGLDVHHHAADHRRARS